MSNKVPEIYPMGTRVLLETVEEEQMIGSLHIPETEKNNESKKAKVVRLGDGVNSKGKKIDFRTKLNDIVLYKKYSGEDVDVNGVKYVIIEESDIIAIVK